MNSFSRTVDLLQRSMDTAALRYQVTANNLANAEVPNFKRSSINFESELKKALESQEHADETFVMHTTNDKHVESVRSTNYQDVLPQRVLDYTTTSKANGNNVDAEQEAMSVLKIQLNYQLLTQLQAFEFAQVKSVLK